MNQAIPFYNSLATEYDQMTNVADRSKQIDAFISRIMKENHITSILNVACGTNIYTIKLAQYGIKATGVDLSDEMIKQAKQSADNARVTCQWHCCTMQNLADELHETFDYILCLGNSIVHLLTENDMCQTLRGFRSLLNPGGKALIGLLNYNKILREKKRIISINRHDNIEYIRFYDYINKLLQFNILKITWKQSTPAYHINSCLLKPYTYDDITKALKQADFTNINCYNDLTFASMTVESESVFIEAQRE